MATAGSIVVDLLMRTGAFETDTARAEKLMKQRMKAIEEAVNKAAAAAAGAGVVVAGAMALMVKNASAAADELSKLSQRTGVTVQSLSALNYAASLNDASIQELGNGIKGLSNKMLAAQSGSKEAAAVFDALGISVTKSDGTLRSVDSVLLDVAEAFAKMEDGAGKSAIANKLMEEAGIRLIPMLNNGRDGLSSMAQEAELLGKTMERLAPFSVELNDNITRLNTQQQTFAATLAMATVPALNEVAKEILGASKETALFDLAAGAAKTTIETLAIVGANVAFVFAGVGREIGGIAAQMAALASLDFKAFSNIGDMMKEDARKARAELDAFEKRVFNPTLTATASPTPRTAAPVLAGAGSSAKKPATYTDPLAESAKLYASALEAIDKAQISAQTSGMELTATQQRLMELFSDPVFLNMPDTWKQTVVSAAESAIATEEAAKQAEELNRQHERLNELIGEAAMQKQIADMDLLSEAFNNGRISVEQFEKGIRAAFGLEEDKEGGYWAKWLESAEKSLTSFDELSASVVEKFSSGFGDAFERMIFDAGDAGEAASAMAEGMARSVVNALGQMAAQWLAYQVVQAMVGKTTAASAATAQTFDAMASQQMAAINAFASTAAIPVVGPAMAPAAAAAALAATSPFVATIASLGAAAAGARATGGPVSADMPYLIGERGPELFVPNTAGRVLPNSALGGTGGPTINLIEDKRRAGQTQERTGANGKQEIDIFVADLMGDGPRAKAIARRFGLTAKGY
ncbi:hypothetical protein ACLIIZ_03050 [Azonexus caeni]|uniref:hypothetical protein n=1 Tax=Azonexus caeni TaxID=266126 RepID=UPI003A859F27